MANGRSMPVYARESAAEADGDFISATNDHDVDDRNRTLRNP
jgi:hypothetical protein